MNSSLRHSFARGVPLAIAVLAGLAALTGCSGASPGGPTGSATETASDTGRTAASAAAAVAAAAKSRIPDRPPSAIAATALDHLKAASAVHVDITSSLADNTISFSDDATADGGRQEITIGSSEHATILLIDGVGYVKANEAALESYIGVQQADAARYAGRWVEVHDGEHLGTTEYKNLVAGITLKDVAAELIMTAPYTFTGTSTIAGQRVMGVRAHLPASGDVPASARNVLYVTNDARVLPVLDKVVGAPRHYQMSLSQWSESLHLTAPTDTIQAPAD